MIIFIAPKPATCVVYCISDITWPESAQTFFDLYGAWHLPI